MKRSTPILVIALGCRACRFGGMGGRDCRETREIGESVAGATPGVAFAGTLSQITGVAISPMLGVSAVGAYTYFRTPTEKRASLPWYARPAFWIPALLLVAACACKDSLGPSFRPAGRSRSTSRKPWRTR